MTNYTVTNNNNSGVGSLRWALELANSNQGLDSIEIQSNVTLNSALNISDDVNIYSLMGSTITQTGNARLFNINDGDDANNLDVSFDGLKLTGGSPVATGGAILSYENLSLVDVEVFGNATTKRGGGVYQEGGSLYVRGSKFYDNDIAKGSTSAGGGIYVTEGELEIVGSTFERNSAIAGGGVTLSSGATAKINGSKFFRNDGSGIAVFSSSDLDLSNSEIKENKSTDFSGGGVAIENASAVITNVEVFGNFASYGGGVEVLNSDVKIVDSTITGNSSLEAGGGIDVYNNSTLEVINSTISTNSSNFGGGIASEDGTSQITLIDTIVERNTIGDIAGDDIDVITTEDVNPTEDVNIFGGRQNELIEGNSLDNDLRGRGGDDTLHGGSGNDTIRGNDGDDILYGDAGDDRLIGNSGNDTFNGGSGFDIFFGGTGNDTFVIGEGTTRILDFEVGTDIIGLADGIDYDDLTIVGRNNTRILVDGNQIAIVKGIQGNVLNESHFTQDY